VLSVTSDVDSDPIGLVDGVDLHQAPFEHMEASKNISCRCAACTMLR